MVPITMTEDKQSRGCSQDRPQFSSRLDETLRFRVSYLVSVNLNSLFLFPME